MYVDKKIKHKVLILGFDHELKIDEMSIIDIYNKSVNPSFIELTYQTEGGDYDSVVLFLLNDTNIRNKIASSIYTFMDEEIKSINGTVILCHGCLLSDEEDNNSWDINTSVYITNISNNMLLYILKILSKINEYNK